MIKPVVITVGLLVVIGGGAFGVDRTVAAAAEGTITGRIEQQFAGSSSVSTRIHGIPVLTQVARGSLDDVTVSLDHVPTSAGLVLDVVDVELRDVATAAPYLARTVTARALVTMAALETRLGAGWAVRASGRDLIVTGTGLLPVTVRVTPRVQSGRLVLTLASVSRLGVEVEGANIPRAVTDRVAALADSVGTLPLGLALDSVEVGSRGVTLTASGADISLESV